MDEKEIRFIDSHYNELFRIKDGESITVKYPDGHTENRECKYIDEYHTYIGSNGFHICEWAELMEAKGCKYYSASVPKFSLESITQDEFEYTYAKNDESIDRGCIGHFRADFDKGKSFYYSWWPENENLKTQEFKTEFDNHINYFRKESDTPILKSRSDMYNNCNRLNATRSDNDREICGFKVITENHTYYLRCNTRVGEYCLYAYCYDNSVLEKYKNIKLVNDSEKHINKDKFFLTDDGVIEVYYNPDSIDGGQIVYNEIPNDLIQEASKFKTKDNFFEVIDSGCKQILIDISTPEFRENFKSYIDRKPDFEGINDKTMKGLMKHAGVKEKGHKDIDMER